MSASSSALESEDLDNIPLVRMADIQPAREIIIAGNGTIIASEIDYGNQLTHDDDDSNIGSLSVQSEEVVGTEGTEDDEDSDSEMIVPEFVSDELPIDIPESVDTKPAPGSWPTLEILPGGVIKHAAEKEDELGTSYQAATESDSIEDTGDMMYACAKCPQRFKYLFCLVKHVRWHEDEKKKLDGADLSKLNSLERDLISIKRARLDIEKQYRMQKSKIMARIANAMADLGEIKAIRKPKKRQSNTNNNKFICLHSGKRKIVSKKRTPKKL